MVWSCPASHADICSCPRQSARSIGASPILDGADPLADLTRSLDDRINADAYHARGPSPFQVATRSNTGSRPGCVRVCWVLDVPCPCPATSQLLAGERSSVSAIVEGQGCFS